MPASRVVLDTDTLHIGFHGSGKASYPEDMPVGGALRAMAQHMKIDLETKGVFWGDYCFCAGVTGESFRFLDLMYFHPLKIKTPPLAELYHNMSTREMYHAAMEAMGLEYQFYGPSNMPEPAAAAKLIAESIGTRGIPAIGYGLFDAPEPFLITGYDDGGSTLIGWSHFQGEAKSMPGMSFEPTGQFRLADGVRHLEGLLIVTGEKKRQAPREIYLGAIKRAAAELATRQPESGPCGTAALERWALRMENDALFVGQPEEELKKLVPDFFATAGDIAERRALAGDFMTLAVRALPEAKAELDQARGCFWAMHDNIYEIWETVARNGPFDPDPEKLRDPLRRRKIAALIREMIQQDTMGATLLKRAAAKAEHQDAGESIDINPRLTGTVILNKAPAAAQKVAWAPENIWFPNTMVMAQQFLGESWGELNAEEQKQGKLDYVLWMGISGAAFGRLSDDPKPINLPLAFEALGYDYELWLNKKLAEESKLPCQVWGWDDNLRRRMMWNMREHQLPVLLFNCGQWPNWYLVTQVQGGFDFAGYGGNNGEGYRPNAPLDDPKNPLRKIDVFGGIKMSHNNTWTIHLLARRAGKPNLNELYTRALTFGSATLATCPMTLLDAQGQEYLSQHPYDDWVAMLRNDALYPAHDSATLTERREWMEGQEVELAERRFYGSEFLRLAAVRLQRPALAKAAEHFRNIHDHMQQLWKTCGGLHAKDAAEKIADRNVRAAMAEQILQIKAEEEMANKLIAQ